MKALWLDYQASPPGRHRPGYAFLALGVLAMLTLVALDVRTGDAIGARKQQVTRLQRGLERSGAAAASAAKAPPAAQASARWEAFFNALEQAADENVTLLGLAPGSKEIAISGEAKDLDSAFDYVKRLQAAPALADAHLTEYAVDKEQPRHPVKFSVVAQWKGTA